MLGDDEDLSERRAPERVPAGPARGGAIMPVERGRGYGAYEWFGDDVREESSIDVQKYLRVLRKHWLVILAVLVLALAAGVIKTLLTTPIYTASATLQIDREAAEIGGYKTVEQREFGSDDEFFQTQHALLKSRELATRTVDENDLPNNQQVLNAFGLGKPGKDGRRPSTTAVRNQLINIVQGNVNVFQVARSRLIRVTFDSPNAQTSAQLVNLVGNTFIKWNLDRRFRASDYSRNFLQEAITTEQAKFEAAQRQLADTAEKNQIINIGGTGLGEKGATASASTTLVGANLMTANAQLAAAVANKITAEQRYVASQQPNALIPEILNNVTIQTYKTSYATLASEYRQKGMIFRENYPEMVALKARMEELEGAIAAATNEVRGSLKSAYEQAVNEEAQAKENVDKIQRSFLSQNRQGIEFGIQKMAADTSQAQYENLLAQSRETSIAGAITKNNITMVDEAQTPNFPSKPAPKKNLLAAGLIGLALGIAMAFLLEYLDESIRMPEDVERKLGLPLLGTIPKLERGMTPGGAIADVRSAFSESYYSVRTALQFSTEEGLPSSLLVTSARPSEGKSTSAVAIAQNFARLGLRVLLIDGDLRNPSLHRVLQIENTAGLSNYLTGGMPLARVVQPTATACLSFIPCGPLPPNPAELLAGSRVEMLLREARGMFDCVVVDGPPIMGLADGPLLASVVSGTMIVIEAGGTGRNLARVAVRRLNVGAPRILGVLLTKFDAKKSSYGYGYGYGYAYDYAYGSKPQIKGGT